MHRESSRSSEPKVSIVVPFYNIENCVSYCLDSLLDQTYDDYEIVCIDDGSTDGTGDLLERYAADHANIKLFHKKNGGLSDARNYGVQKARGEYVSFVDGDDCVSPFYVEALVETQRSTGADFVLGTSKRVRQKDVANVEFTKPLTGKLVSKEDLIEDILYERHLPNAWSNLAPRDLYARNPFPTGAYYEEIATIGAFIRESENVAVIEEPIYGYVMRPNSIVHRKNAKVSQITDYQDAKNRFLTNVSAICEISEGGVRYFEALHDTRIYRLLQRVDDEAFRTEWSQKIRHNLQGSLSRLMKDSNIDSGNKMRFFLLARYPKVYPVLFEAYDFIRK